MWTEVFDDDAPAVVWLFSGPVNTDDDFDRWLLAMARLGRVTAERQAVGLLIIDDGNPAPRPVYRERLSAVARGLRSDAPLAVVTSSGIARGVIAALHVAGVVGFPLKGFADAGDACAWLIKRRPRQDAQRLLALVDEARAKAARRQA
jgi:hypothetical protein